MVPRVAPTMHMFTELDSPRSVCFLPRPREEGPVYRIQLLPDPSLEFLSPLAESPDNQPVAAKSLQSCPILCDPIDNQPRPC